MIANEAERAITQKIIDESNARDTAGEETSAGGRAMQAQMVREAAMWDAVIREPVPPSAELPPPLLDEDLDDAAIAAYLKRAEVANIDRQVGIALDRIADWRRHRAWLEREITELEAPPAGADPVGSAAIDADPVPIEEAVRAG